VALLSEAPKTVDHPRTPQKKFYLPTLVSRKQRGRPVRPTDNEMKIVMKMLVINITSQSSL
jgi:hypothetical protein